MSNPLCHRQKFSVNYEYPVYFTHNVFSPDNLVLLNVLNSFGQETRHKLLIYIDDGVMRATPELIPNIAEYVEHRPDLFDLMQRPEMVPGGERTKNGWNIVQNIMTSIGNGHLCRHSFVVAIGGGSVLDMVGFAGSLVHRGIRLIRIPTTVLAQADGGVGVKNGMDEHGQKNFVGTFAPPAAVINDFSFLKTLDDKYWIGGISEAYKVAIIKDSRFLDYLCENAALLSQRNEQVIEEVVRRTALLHLDHIATSGDPFEFGTARPLDFGHWAAHKLELLSNYLLGHGQAVAIGIALDSVYASRKGLITDTELETILHGMRETGLPIWDDHLLARSKDGVLEILNGLSDFREHLGGKLTVTLPDGLGRRIEVHDMDTPVIEEAIEYLQATNSKISS